jgi:hypothetical protein
MPTTLTSTKVALSARLVPVLALNLFTVALTVHQVSIVAVKKWPVQTACVQQASRAIHVL